MLESSHDSLINTSEGLFIVTTPHDSVTLLVTWHALVMKMREYNIHLELLKAIYSSLRYENGAKHL